MGLILLLTLVTGQNKANMEYPHFDKVIHLLSFCVLTFFMIVGFIKQDRYSLLRFNATRYAILISIVYGVVLELLQWFISGRSLKVFDVVSDAVGCVLGYYLFVFVYRILK